jgi:hypothetical protein
VPVKQPANRLLSGKLSGPRKDTVGSGAVWCFGSDDSHERIGVDFGPFDFRCRDRKPDIQLKSSDLKRI